MKFQELLAGKQINWDRVKLIRHNLTKEEIAAAQNCMWLMRK